MDNDGLPHSFKSAGNFDFGSAFRKDSCVAFLDSAPGPILLQPRSFVQTY